MMIAEDFCKSLLNVSDPHVREAVQHRQRELSAHGCELTDAQLVIWLIDYGARVYLATVPQEKAVGKR